MSKTTNQTAANVVVNGQDGGENTTDVQTLDVQNETATETETAAPKKAGKNGKGKTAEPKAKVIPQPQVKLYNEETIVLTPKQLEIRENLNKRINYGTKDMAVLVEQIREHGIITPLKGYYNEQTGKYVIVEGHRRHKAIQQLVEEGVKVSVPFRLEASTTTDIDRLLGQILSNDGKQFNVYEKALVCQELQEVHGLGTAEVATKIGVTQRYVQRLNKLIGADKKLIKLVVDGKVSGTLAIEAANKGEAAVEELVNAAAQKNGGGEGELYEGATANAAAVKRSELASNTNSIKELKEFFELNAADVIHEDNVEFYNFIGRILDNDIKYDGIKRWFNKSHK